MPSSSSPMPLNIREVLEDAVKADMSKDYDRALRLYSDGCELLMRYSTKSTCDEYTKSLRQKLNGYLKRAEEIKRLIEQTKWSHCEEIRILDDDTGIDFERIFNKCYTCRTQSIIINDPYIRTSAQIQNLVRLCEFVLAKRPNQLTKMVVYTSKADNPQHQKSQIDRLKQELHTKYAVEFDCVFVDSLQQKLMIDFRF
ncbi:hypothetical protein ACOME3_006302 [Neoechinorhynchus agilis]